MKTPQAPLSPLPEDAERKEDELRIVESLNHHGMFFQQAIYHRFLNYKHAIGRKNPFKVEEVLCEHPTYFNGHGAADLVAITKFKAEPHGRAVDVTFVVECKKVFPPLNRIVLFGDALRHQTRLMWESSATGNGDKAWHDLGWLRFDQEPGAPVCNDGLWLDRKKESESWKANKDPLYKAANQVCGHLMGVMSSTRSRALTAVHFGRTNTRTFFLPIIVTNCPLFVAECPEGLTDFESGEASGVSLKPVEAAFYIHPFARIPSDVSDVRNDYDDLEGDDMERDKQTILIARPPALESLLGENLQGNDLVNVLYRPLYDQCLER